MEKIASFIIILGTFLWLFSIIVFEGRWQWQMFSALVLILGIFCAHFWEELRDTGNSEEGDEG
ncbi:hypothetical protein F4009_06660 [Candidatus Poribacteria bacterium]|nr:hypothetical protein [Candidatus Poribacteria bacterium]MDE0399071.1 hypothetical protein [Candidatus Poribacteria bacterium]MYA69861.1 hypothetical protein [Candidatus Poribacteria bacterium]MYB94123.1 hypothetical protein [Candidatus Poribacteria bacterium]MYG08530.1 hypothetical protein [Candidatus Poribacteria bacterium]